MEYPPKHHQEASFENIVNLINAYPLGTIHSSVNDQIESSHTPLIYNSNKKFGYLVGHLDKYNPQLAHFKVNPKVNLIFHGPQVYISPSVYRSTQLPTWNYFKAHLKGRIFLETDREKVRTSLIQMTAFLEGDSPRFILKKDNPRMEKALDYIVGFRIEIDQWEGKYKISQDKRKEDRDNAKLAMIEAEKKIKPLVEFLYQKHHTKSS